MKQWTKTRGGKLVASPEEFPVLIRKKSITPLRVPIVFPSGAVHYQTYTAEGRFHGKHDSDMDLI